MGTNCELFGLLTDRSKALIEEIAAQEGLNDANFTVGSATIKGDNYLGQILRIKINGMRENKSKDSFNFILKLAPTSSELRDMLPIKCFYKNEIFAYTQMLPVLIDIQERFNLPPKDKFRCCKIYKHIPEECSESLFLEDLSEKGFKMYDRLESFDYDHMVLTIKKLAQLHSTSFVLNATQPAIFKDLASKTNRLIDFGKNFDVFVTKNIKKSLTLIEDDRDRAKIANLCETAKSKAQMFVLAEFAEPYNVLCHGDCWPNNFMFRYDEGKVVDMALVDWQLVRCSSPVIDMAYLLFTGMDKEMINKHYHEMLDVYYEALSQNLSKMGHDVSVCYPENVYRDQIKNIMIYGLIIAIAVLPLTLSSRDEARDLDHFVLEDEANTEEGDTFYTDRCITRMKDIIRFSIDNGIV